MWHNPKGNIVKDKTKSKNTGGKQPYLMLMVNEVENLKKKDLDNNDCRMVCGNTKRSNA